LLREKRECWPPCWSRHGLMFSLHAGTWSGLPHRDAAASRKRQEAREKAIVAEVAALDGARPKSKDTLVRWQVDTENKDPHKGRVLPAPWAPRKQDWDVTALQLKVAQTSDPDEECSPKTWDAEMIQMCGENAKAALRGRACDFVEPYVPLMKSRKMKENDKVSMFHHQLPSPCNDRGSGFHVADGEATVRYNLQLDGRRPFLAGAAGRGQYFCREPRFLPQQDLAAWDQERIMAPDRAYGVSERGASIFHDEQRKGLPAWKPAGKQRTELDPGKKPTSQLSRIGATVMKP